MKKLALLLILLVALPTYAKVAKTKVHHHGARHLHHHAHGHKPHHVSNRPHVHKLQHKKQVKTNQDGIQCHKSPLCNVLADNMTDDRIKRVLEVYGTPKHAHSKIIVAIAKAAKKHHVSKTMLVTIMAKESSFNARAVSTAGAEGLMQIMPLHHVRRPFDIDENVDAGARILSEYVNEAGSIEGGLKDYGNGWRYVVQVLQTLKRIQNIS